MADLKPLKLLIIEDSDDDAVLITEELQRGGYQPVSRRVDSAEDLRQALAHDTYEIVISDYSLPQFTAMQALEIVHKSGKDIPTIVVSGSVREATIVETMRAGARDYVMRENLTRLPLAVERELEEAAERRKRRQFDDQLRHTQRLESLGVLAGGVAHDFNNLLTGILGNVSLAMERASCEAPIHALLEEALAAAEQAANLTRQMLAYAGKGQFCLEPVELSAVIRDINALLHASVSKNIELRFELRDTPPVDADRGQLQQVMMNLVTNAAEAIGSQQPGSIVVAAGLRRLSEAELSRTVTRDQLQPGLFVSMEVRDTGHGMDAATVSRIFDPFFTTKFTGRGLGLSAVMGIVRSHKGALQVKSQPGRGSVFTVFLPVSRQANRQIPEVRSEETDSSGDLILVIDDEETIRKTAKAILENRGLRVMLAASGDDGLDALRRDDGRISLVILDLTMPHRNGNQVLHEIRSLGRDVPVIMSSGYNQEDVMDRVTAGEAAGFIQKPYTAAQLLEKIRAVLDARRAGN
jgi:signal transduction histidine kinase